MVKEDRSLGMFILLSIVTCGIYQLYFMHKLAEDMNRVCAGDGKKTNGILMFYILTVVTCGIYAWVWYYKLGDRQQANGRRYNVHIQEGGSSVLAWLILGSFVFGIGVFVAWHIIIKNMNMLARGYNQQGMRYNQQW